MTDPGREIERVLIVAIAGSAIYLGFRLFYLVKEKQGDLRLQGREFQLSLSDVAPGIYFALFGSVVLAVSLFKGVESSSSKTEEQFQETQPAPVRDKRLMTTKTTQTWRGFAPSRENGASDNNVEDFENDTLRIYEPLTKVRDITKLRSYRNILRQSLGDGTAQNYWRDTSLESIRAEITPLVSETYFQTALIECKSLEDLRVFLESYVPFFFLKYSKPR